MTEDTPSNEKPPIEPDTIEFLQKVFERVRSGDAAEIGPLLEHGLPPNLRNQKGDSFLMLAAYHGHHDVARLLLEHGADAELPNDQGQTPLAGAAYKGDLEMVRLLLDHGAKVDGALSDGKTALMFAAMFNRVEVLDLLLARGANPLAQEAKGNTARSLAEVMGAKDTAARLDALAAAGSANAAG
jgi:hypothetical protein